MNLHSIVSPIIGAINPNEFVSVSTSIGNTVAPDGSVKPGYATPGAITASIGGTFTASIPDPVNNPTVLNVSAVLTGSLQVTDIVSGTDGVHSLPVGTSILAQLSGPAGSAGTYQISTGATLNASTVTASSTVLNASAVAAGLLQVGQTLADGSSVLAAGTMITGQISGARGGAGLYSISKQQTVAAETMTTTLILLGQIQPVPTGSLQHSDSMNVQAQYRALYYNGAIDGVIRAALKGGDIVVRARNGEVYLVTSDVEDFFETSGWSKVIIQLQNGS